MRFKKLTPLSQLRSPLLCFFAKFMPANARVRLAFLPFHTDAVRFDHTMRAVQRTCGFATKTTSDNRKGKAHLTHTKPQSTLC